MACWGRYMQWTITKIKMIKKKKKNHICNFHEHHHFYCFWSISIILFGQTGNKVFIYKFVSVLGCSCGLWENMRIGEIVPHANMWSCISKKKKMWSWKKNIYKIMDPCTLLKTNIRKKKMIIAHLNFLFGSLI